MPATHCVDDYAGRHGTLHESTSSLLGHDRTVHNPATTGSHRAATTVTAGQNANRTSVQPLLTKAGLFIAARRTGG